MNCISKPEVQLQKYRIGLLLLKYFHLNDIGWGNRRFKICHSCQMYIFPERAESYLTLSQLFFTHAYKMIP
jgi:hypothetical protein